METKYWFCDRCGEKVYSNGDNGFVQWLTNYKDHAPNAYNIQIVHNKKPCLFTQNYIQSLEESVMYKDMPLEYYLGTDGLMNLLEIISYNDFQDNEEVLEIIKRIHIPGYELTRKYFARAIREGVFEPNTKDGYYTQEIINTIADYYNLK